LEAGIRIVALLEAAYPRYFDLQKLIAFDYLLVHTGDVGGPESLHPPVPMQSAALLVRRQIVERALLLMMTRNLVEREVGPEGIRYRGGENATPFIGMLQSEYLIALRERATWLVDTLADHSDTNFRQIMRDCFDRWVEEFQIAENSLGVD
jgi:hypothetical protein